MRRLFVAASLMMFAMAATVFMFMNALIERVPGAAATVYVLAVGILTVIVLLLFALVVLVFVMTDIIHHYKLKWEDRENRYEMERRHRELQLEKHRQEVYGLLRRRVRFSQQLQKRYPHSHRSNNNGR